MTQVTVSINEQDSGYISGKQGTTVWYQPRSVAHVMSCAQYSFQYHTSRQNMAQYVVQTFKAKCLI